MLGFGHSKGYYNNPEKFTYYSIKYRKFITVPKGYPSDGATGAFDVCEKAYIIHDVLCDRGVFDDGTPCNNWQASYIIGDILDMECNRYIRKHTWRWMTWLFGGGKARKNGMY